MVFSATLTINSAARFLCAPDWSWDTQDGFADNDLWVVLGGAGSMQTPGGTYSLARGDVFLLAPRTRYVATHQPNDPLSVIAVHFSSGQPLSAPLHRRLVPVEFLAGILERLLRAHLQAPAETAQFWLRAALAEIATTDQAQTDGRMQARIRELVTQIRERPGDRWELSALAGRFGLSQQHFSRLFKTEAGHPPGSFVLAARIAAAKAYLRGSSLPIKRIASLTGSHDEFHLSNQFLRHVGVRPSVYRKGANPS